MSNSFSSTSLLVPLTELTFKNSGSNQPKIYWVLVIGVLMGICSLPFLYTDIGVRSPGIIRPNFERTDIRSIMSGVIDTVFCKEGAFVKEGSVILRLRNENTIPKLLQNKFEITHRMKFVHDLELLTLTPQLTPDNIAELESPVYKQQISRFLYQKTELEASLKKVKKELHIDTLLSLDKVIAPKEMFDKVVEDEKLQAAYSAFKNEQISLWQQDLAKYRLELSQLQAQCRQMEEENKLYIITAPVSGVVQGINSRYAGGIVQLGETLGTISPETDLIAECYTSPQDVGLLKENQQARLQIDAFDYNYFGILTGRIISIDNDFTLIDNKPLFKVRCSFDSYQLHLKNGYTGRLKKGLTLQARFVVARRSLWQLLFDKIDDWLNPMAPLKK